ncbi:alpha/beta fold hydrolase [Aquirhabdus sp.]|uniref:alpha/beta fold hydrolase n=1 Tax=Aquirhabdus sp. TaxID=2824160 RepID=UPI00396C8FAA
MQTVIHHDVELSTLSLGPEGGEPVILLHGLVSGNMATWYTSIAIPLATTSRVVLYDLRGHGNSSLPQQGFDLDSQVQDLLAVLNYCLAGRQPVDLVGHSMGALIALRFALRFPHLVRRLVLVDAPMPAKQWVAPSLVAAESSSVLAQWINEQPYLANDVRGRRRERIHKRLESLLFGTSIVADVLAMDAEPDEDLRDYTQPVLLIYGRASPCLAAGHHLHETLPNAELRLLDCGHYVPVEAPDALRQILEQYLNKKTQRITESE